MTEAEVLFIGIKFQEYNVRPNSCADKNFFIGRFVTGLPAFSKKKNADNKWSLHKEGLQGRQVTDTLRVLIQLIYWLCNFIFQLLKSSQGSNYFP